VIDPAGVLGSLASSDQGAITLYKPRRAVLDSPEAVESSTVVAPPLPPRTAPNLYGPEFKWETGPAFFPMPTPQPASVPSLQTPRLGAGERGSVQSPISPPTPWAAPVPRSQWADPVGAPLVADLATNRPGTRPEACVDGALQTGRRPTILRRATLATRALPRWESGAIDENPVFNELDRLRAADSRWSYLNSVPIGKKDLHIDHLVVGPGGVFAINAKHHRNARITVTGDTVTVNGIPKPYVRNSRNQAQRASDLLTSATRISIRVRGLVVPAGAATFTVKHQSNTVEVVNRSALVQFLRSQPPYLDGTTIDRILGYARLSSTWRPLPGVKAR